MKKIFAVLIGLALSLNAVSLSERYTCAEIIEIESIPPKLSGIDGCLGGRNTYNISVIYINSNIAETFVRCERIGVVGHYIIKDYEDNGFYKNFKNDKQKCFEIEKENLDN